jgi:hypothetical protein
MLTCRQQQSHYHLMIGNDFRYFYYCDIKINILMMCSLLECSEILNSPVNSP